MLLLNESKPAGLVKSKVLSVFAVGTVTTTSVALSTPSIHNEYSDAEYLTATYLQSGEALV
jgi:hypothetical protein